MGGAYSTNEKRNVCRLLVESKRERNQWEDQDVSGWIILGWLLERWDWVFELRDILLQFRYSLERLQKLIFSGLYFRVVG
jgi:hypothetical protein